ncbi:MAG TPA: DegT/DnrJ/EryC1/StrS family aminotransferase [Steroidobacteraceae bacterium]|jgi:perosamine synthetase|nr:DegT/DnrJ/EryC1/StrS family aminotransferase [Steroidobacteraceae bacterium]
MKSPVPVNIPVLDGDEKRLLIECIDSGWISSDGPFVKDFEQKFCARLGRAFGVAVTNGTAALEAALVALNLEVDDEVILPSHTIISCAQAIIRAGAKPVAIDCDPLTWNMTAAHVAEAITRRTRAIMVVHIFGLPVDMGPMLKLAHDADLKIIEDAAQAYGQTWEGRPCGSFGNVSTFSFYPNKLLTTGEGGMIVTDDPKLAEHCRSLRNLCFQPQRRFIHEELGWNLRMTNLQAALGLAQLPRLDEFLSRKRQMGRYYTSRLSDIPGLQLPLASTNYAENMYWVYPIVLSDQIPFDAAEAMRRFAEEEIGTRPFFWPIHEQPVFQRMGLFPDTTAPVSEKIARRGLYIPSGLGMTQTQMDRVIDVARKIFSP